MSTSNRLAAISALAVIALQAPGCTADHLVRSDKVTLQAGDAVAFNRAVQTRDPWPPYVWDRDILFNGTIIDNAINRYQTDQTIQPEGLDTSDVAGGGRPLPPPPPPPTRQ